MNAKITELVFILDRSGSMGGLEGDTIGGFNGMIDKQRKDIKKRGDHNEKVNITTVLFDDQVEVIHDRFDIAIVKPLTDDDYYVRGCTALLDAVGDAIRKAVAMDAEEVLFGDDWQEEIAQYHQKSVSQRKIGRNV